MSEASPKRQRTDVDEAVVPSPATAGSPGTDASHSPATASIPGAGTSSTTTRQAEDIATLLALDPGRRLEIKWDLVNDDTGESAPRWWGCTLGNLAGTHTLVDDEEDGSEEGLEVCNLYEITYDPFLPDFPEQSTQKVCFLSTHMIYCPEEDATFCWRSQGDSWDEDDDEDGDDEATGEDVPSTGDSAAAAEV